MSTYRKGYYFNHYQNVDELHTNHLFIFYRQFFYKNFKIFKSEGVPIPKPTLFFQMVITIFFNRFW